MDSRHTFIIAYDITCDRRRERVYSFLRGWGDHLQFSVFRAVLAAPDLARVQTEIHDRIQHDEDQVLFFDLGPTEGRAQGSVRAIGLAYTHPERHAVVV